MQQLLMFSGGLGVFLLGVVIMTDGLRGMAGDSLHAALTRFTRSPASGALTGAVSTAILQSSSATTVAAVGFVSAGLLSFPQALGIIFGANLGTTVTGWLVAVLGFKLALGQILMPLILVGVVLRLLAAPRLAAAGMAVAGFGLIFVGIATMQSGLSEVQGLVDFDGLSGDTWASRFKLLFIGIIFTVLTQSSSAGVAAALNGVHAGALSFEQAAVLVIGMDIGSSVKAIIASLGGSTETRRTGLSHVLYNLFAGALALLLVGVYTEALRQLAPQWLQAEAELALVAFHTGFNLLALLIVVPMAGGFARLVERLVPERHSPLLARLDERLLDEPAVALEAARASLDELARILFGQARALLQPDPQQPPASLMAEWYKGFRALQRYLGLLHIRDEHSREARFLRGAFHALDHLQRLRHRLEQAEPSWPWREWPLVQAQARQLQVIFDELPATSAWPPLEARLQALVQQTEDAAEQAREQIIARVVSGEEEDVRGARQLDAARWLRRVSVHLWRVAHHMAEVESLSLLERKAPTQDLVATRTV